MSKEDPHKTIETGSFRVNSKGQQVGVTSKRYAGSEAHLTELMEGVCDLMSNYGVSTDTKTGTKSYIRINSRAGESITLSNVNFSSDGSRELKNAVSSILTMLMRSDFNADVVDVSVLHCFVHSVRISFLNTRMTSLAFSRDQIEARIPWKRSCAQSYAPSVLANCDVNDVIYVTSNQIARCI